MNTIILTGNVTRDAVLRYTPDQKPVMNFTLANNQGFGDKQRTEYYECALWGVRAEKLHEHIAKGQKLVVHGEHSTDRSEKDGKTYFRNKVFVRDLEFAGSRDNQGGSGGGQSPASRGGAPVTPQSVPEVDFDSDIPF